MRDVDEIIDIGNVHVLHAVIYSTVYVSAHYECTTIAMLLSSGGLLRNLFRTKLPGPLTETQKYI